MAQNVNGYRRRPQSRNRYRVRKKARPTYHDYGMSPTIEDTESSSLWSRVSSAVNRHGGYQPRRRNRRYSHHRSRNPFNILDYISWLQSRGTPIKYNPSSRKIYDTKMGKSAKGNMSSTEIYPANGHLIFKRHAHNEWDGDPNSDHRLSALNRFAIMVHDHYSDAEISVNSEEGRKWSYNQINKFVKSYGQEHTRSKYPIGSNSFTNNISGSRNVSRGTQWNHRTYNDIHYSDNEDNIARYHRRHPNEYTPVKRDDSIAMDYLVHTRAINPKIAKTLINDGLIRSFASRKNPFVKTAQDRKNPNKVKRYQSRVEFMRRMPRDAEQSANEDATAKNIKAEPVVGKDTIYVTKGKNGHYKNDKQYPGGCKRISSKRRGTINHYGWNFRTGNGKGSLYVFEAPIDAISYYELHSKTEPMHNATFLSIGGVSKDATIDSYINSHFPSPYQYDHVIITPDNDAAGHSLVMNATSGIRDRKLYSKEASQYLHKYMDSSARALKNRNLAGESKARRFVTTEIPYSDGDKVLINQSLGYDWNDALKAKKFHNADITGGGGKKMSLDNYTYTVIQQGMQSMNRHDKQHLDMAMAGYANITENAQARDEQIDPYNPRVYVMRIAKNGNPKYHENGLSAHGKAVAKNMMDNAGLHNVSGTDLCRYTYHYNKSHGYGSLADQGWVRGYCRKQYGVPHYKRVVAQDMGQFKTMKGKRDYGNLLYLMSKKAPTTNQIAKLTSNPAEKAAFQKTHVAEFHVTPKSHGYIKALGNYGTMKDVFNYTKTCITNPREAKAQLARTRKYANYIRSGKEAKDYKFYKDRSNYTKKQLTIRHNFHKQSHFILTNTPVGQPALDKLKKQGLSADDIDKGGYGFMPKQAIVDSFRTAKEGMKITDKDLLNSSLFKRGKNGNLQPKSVGHIVKTTTKGVVDLNDKKTYRYKPYKSKDIVSSHNATTTAKPKPKQAKPRRKHVTSSAPSSASAPKAKTETSVSSSSVSIKSSSVAKSSVESNSVTSAETESRKPQQSSVTSSVPSSSSAPKSKVASSVSSSSAPVQSSSVTPSSAEPKPVDSSASSSTEPKSIASLVKPHSSQSSSFSMTHAIGLNPNEEAKMSHAKPATDNQPKKQSTVKTAHKSTVKAKPLENVDKMMNRMTSSDDRDRVAFYMDCSNIPKSAMKDPTVTQTAGMFKTDMVYGLNEADRDTLNKYMGTTGVSNKLKGAERAYRINGYHMPDVSRLSNFPPDKVKQMGNKLFSKANALPCTKKICLMPLAKRRRATVNARQRLNRIHGKLNQNHNKVTDRHLKGINRKLNHNPHKGPKHNGPSNGPSLS